MANTQPATKQLNQQTFQIDASQNGVFAECGPAGPGSVGVWTFHWVPDPSFDGGLAVMGRIAGQAAALDGVNMVQIPYRSSYLNNVATGSPLNYGTTIITGTSLFYVDTAQLSAGILISCTTGFGKLYINDAGGNV